VDVFVDLIPYLSAGLILVVIWLVMRFLVPRPEQVRQFYQESMNQHQKNKWEALKEKGGITTVMQTFLLVVGVLFRKAEMPEYRVRITKQLRAAGYPLALNFETYMALIACGGVVGAGLGTLMGIGMSGEFNVPMLLLMMMIGFYLPIQFLKERVQKRRWLISKDLPYKVDLLTLSVEAGMDFQAALENVVARDNTGGPLREELFMVIQEIRVGKTRKEALMNMAARVKTDAMNTLVGNIIQGEAMGTPVGHILKTQAEMMRVQRSHRAEKLAGEAPVKIVFPLLFIFVAVFLVLFGSIIVRYLRGELGL